MTTAARPLHGIRVLELGALVAAPYCGMLLADLGADVVKVEPPEGDMARQFAPFVEGESAFFLSVNRGKRSVRVDLRDPEALSWVRALASRADVVLHNFRTGVVERLGLGYDDLVDGNPGLVYCAISGFGPTGPMARRPAIDLIFQAESGMMAVTGSADGPAVKVGTNAADVYAATTAAACITAALVGRSTSGHGGRIDVSLRDAFLALQACWFTSFLATGEQPGRLGAASPFTAPTDVFETEDGTIVLAVVNGKHWEIFCRTLGLDDLLEDPRYVDNESRVLNADSLRSRVTDVLGHGTTAHWLATFERAAIPAGRVLDYQQVLDDPQVQHNEMIQTMQHPVAGTIRLQGSPFWVDGVKTTAGTPPPVLGQHTREVLLELGCAPHDADRLSGSAT